jgi:FixJ family two-component response regulator
MTAELGPILVVDDDSAVRQALRFALETEGMRVQLYDGPAAILAADDLPAKGCLVVDYSMPVMNGIELVEALHRRSVGLPVILIASRVSNDMRARAARSGIRQVLEKPLIDGALVDTIRSALVTSPH